MRDVFYEGIWLSPDEWYEPPVSMSILAKAIGRRRTTQRAPGETQHPATHVRAASAARAQAFSSLALDYLVFGNAYLEEVRGRLGKRLPFRHLGAKYMRRGGALADRYWWVPNHIERVELPRGRVIHLLEPDIDQNIYGVPDYLAVCKAPG